MYIIATPYLVVSRHCSLLSHLCLTREKNERCHMCILSRLLDQSGSINIVSERWTAQLSSAVCTVAYNLSVSAEMSVTARPSKSESTESPAASS